ncbi:nucleotide-binding domain-containing protein [Biscogniauxia mediterranea]|nr:nucleotide-binding domain-containing protein [Biscogniauxia mediterranea]
MAAQTVTPTTTTSSSDSIVILGAGIIGVSTAYYLSQQQQQQQQEDASEPRPAIHLVEPSPELFASASGYAGGFLARDWFAPAAAALGALSFDEHRRLAEREDGARRWGYAPSTSVSVSYAPAGGRRPRDGMDGCAEGAGAEAGAVADVWCREGGSRAAVASGVSGGDGGKGKGKGDESAPAWLRRREGDEVVVISEEGTVAQVDPLQLCQFLLEKCLSAGVQLHHPSRALSVVTDPTTGALTGLRITTTTAATAPDAAPRTLPCTALVLAAGAWTPSVFSELFPASPLRLPISSLAGHSLVVENNKYKGWTTNSPSPLSPPAQERSRCHAVFLAHAPPNTVGDDAEEEEEDDDDEDGATTTTTTYAPELFSRAAGSIYVAGLNSSAEPLPPLPTDAKARVSARALARLRATAREVLGAEEGEEGEEIRVLREGLCFRPVTRGGTPIVGRVPDGGAGMPAGGGAAVYVAAGHGPWGISMGLGTGRVVAEMVRGRPLSADVAGLGVGEACGMGER